MMDFFEAKQFATNIAMEKLFRNFTNLHKDKLASWQKKQVKKHRDSVSTCKSSNIWQEQIITAAR